MAFFTGLTAVDILKQGFNAYNNRLNAETERDAARAQVVSETVPPQVTVVSVPNDDNSSFIGRNRTALVLGGAGLAAVALLVVATKVLK